MRCAVVASVVVGWSAASFACAAKADRDDPIVPNVDAQTIPSISTDGGTDACTGEAPCAAPVDCTTVDFCPVPLPVSVSNLVALNAIWGSGPNDIWIVGSRGTILHGEGSSFAPIATDGPTDNYVAVWGTSATDVWVIGPSFPLHSTGYQGGTATFEARQGSSWHQDDVEGGRIWTGQSVGDRVWIAGEGSGRFGGLPSSLWTLGDDGMGEAIWNPIRRTCGDFLLCFPGIRGLWAPDANTVWAVGLTGTTFFYDAATSDAGPSASFDLRDSQSREDLNAVWGSGPEDVWAVGEYGTIRHTSRDAKTWTLIPSPTASHLHAVWGTGPNDIWAVGAAGTIIHYDGMSWAPATIGLADGDAPPDLYGIWGSGPDDVWVVGAGHILHRSTTNRGPR